MILTRCDPAFPICPARSYVKIIRKIHVSNDHPNELEAGKVITPCKQNRIGEFWATVPQTILEGKYMESGKWNT